MPAECVKRFDFLYFLGRLLTLNSCELWAYVPNVDLSFVRPRGDELSCFTHLWTYLRNRKQILPEQT